MISAEDPLKHYERTDSMTRETDRQHSPGKASREHEWCRMVYQQLHFVEQKMGNLLENASELIPESSGMTPLAAMWPEERRRFEALRKMQRQLLHKLEYCVDNHRGQPPGDTLLTGHLGR